VVQINAEHLIDLPFLEFAEMISKQNPCIWNHNPNIIPSSQFFILLLIGFVFSVNTKIMQNHMKLSFWEFSFKFFFLSLQSKHVVVNNNQVETSFR